MEFKSIELEDLDHYLSYLRQSKEIPFPLASSIVYGYKDILPFKRAYCHNLCWQKQIYKNETYFFPPLGNWDTADWENIFESIPENIKFVFIPEYLYQLWIKLFPNSFEASTDEGEWDYIYDLKTLALDNRNMRRLSNKFKESYEYSIEPISKENIHVIKAFNQKASDIIEKKSHSDFDELESDNIALDYILNNWCSLKNLDGFLIKVEDKYVSYMITEAVTDKELFALYSKNDYSYTGVGQMVISELQRIYNEKGFERVNYANDANSEGLRTFKNRMQTNKKLLKNYHLLWKGKGL